MALLPWPKPEPPPEPGPDSLFDRINWMTFPHQQLHAMVHKRLDLSGATEVAARWAELGEALREIGDELGRVLAMSVTAWEGEAAELARGGIASLSQWAHDAGATATELSGCVSIEAHNADVARRSMPEPIPLLPKGTFATPGFEQAGLIVEDPRDRSRERATAHREAARVLEQFQQSSREVYGNVPEFAAPALPVPEAKPVPPPEVPPEVPPPPTDTRPSDSSPASPVVTPPVQPPPQPPPVPLGVGTVAVPEVAPPPQEHRAARGGPATPAASPGMMPPPGVGAGRGEDQERKSPSYLEGDPSVFDPYGPLPPSVIGED